MDRRALALDLVLLPLLVVVHCAVVFAILCLYIYGVAYATYAPTQAQALPRIVGFIVGFCAPIGLALAAAWLDWRFVLGKIARTKAARIAAAIAIYGFAIAIPWVMLPTDIIIGCMVTSAKVGKPICL